ncbi:hypothetical protein E2I00_014170, partial [Balaenoptera physalus]
GRNSAVAASVCRALFIGSCIYFDRKRQSDPTFKNRLREQRKKQKLSKERAVLSKLPDLKDAEAPQQLLQVLQQTLPPPVFQRLLTKLPTIRGLEVLRAWLKMMWNEKQISP